jgi:hemoglobin
MEQKASLFERIGGVEAVVDIFYVKVLADESVSHFFTNVDMGAQSSKMKSFLGYALGALAPIAVYGGKRMKQSHQHLHITNEHFDIVADYLVATLKELHIAQNLIDEVIAIVLSTKADVVSG